MDFQVDGTLETHVHLSPHTPAGDPPEPEELVKAIQDLEVNIASSDEKVREKIANLPKEVSDVTIISKIEGKLRFANIEHNEYNFYYIERDAADQLSAQVNSAVLLLSQYNTRLQTEMEQRKKVAVMMRDFLQAQEELLAQAERNLEV